MTYEQRKAPAQPPATTGVQPQPRRMMRNSTMRPPTAAELLQAQEAWAALWAEETEAHQQKLTNFALRQEWPADEALAKIDQGRGVLRLLPGMAAEQLAMLTHVLHSADPTRPNMAWMENVRRRREAQRERCPQIPDDYLADHVRMQRRNAFIAKMRAKRIAAEADAAAAAEVAKVPPKKPVIRKPTIKRR